MSNATRGVIKEAQAWLESGERLLNVFNKLPREKQLEIFALFREVLMRRGSQGIFPRPRDARLDAIAELFGGMEEYT